MPLKPFCIALFCLVAGWLHAFPPAPYYTLYGMARDQTGNAITADGAVLILLKNGAEVGRTPIDSAKRLDQNYELTVRLDDNRAGTSLYTTKAVVAQGPFSLVVNIGGQQYFPIEVTGSLTAGKGGERVRLDLNLGPDINHDGLPDAWEEWQLYNTGHYPDANGNWPLNLIANNNNFLHNGLTNWQNYIVGTYVGDGAVTIGLTLKEKLPGSVRFEFFGITGKTYTIEHSTNLKTWERIPFNIGAPGTGSVSYKATDVAVLSAYAVPSASPDEFYRLTVR